MMEEIGKCEFCLKPIMDGDQYAMTADMVMLCEEHAPPLTDAINQHQEILGRVPYLFGELDMPSRDEMKASLSRMKYDLALNGDRKLLEGDF